MLLILYAGLVTQKLCMSCNFIFYSNLNHKFMLLLHSHVVFACKIRPLSDCHLMGMQRSCVLPTEICSNISAAVNYTMYLTTTKENGIQRTHFNIS